MIDGRGRALAVWTVRGAAASGYNNQIMWSRGSGAGGWSRATELPQSPLGYWGWGFETSMNASGEALVTWVRSMNEGDYGTLFTKRMHADGTWEDTTAIHPHGGPYQQAWMDRTGTAHVLVEWGASYGLWDYRQPVEGSWGTAILVDGRSLVDAAGSGRHLVALLGGRKLWARTLTLASS